MKDWEVKEIPKKEAIPWFKRKHYAKRVPSLSFTFGLYINKVLSGVVSYGMPPSYTLMFICGKENSDIVIELNRLVMDEGLPKNSTSYLVSHSLKLLPKPKIVVSFADVGCGHVGYIYQACNFLYTGISPKQKYYKLKTQEEEGGYRRRARMSKADIIKDYGEEFVEEYFSTDKHRYVFFVGCKELISSLTYKTQPYPKGETKRYDSGNGVETQNILF